MTSPPNIDFSLLPDIRDKYPGDVVAQTASLRCQMPTAFDNHASSRSGLAGNGISVFVCALRHLFVHVALKWRGDLRDTDNALFRIIRHYDERENPLLRFAWSDLGTDGASLAVQDRTLEVIANHLLEANSLVADLSFRGLAESTLMHTTLFQRPPFQLYHPYYFSQPIEDPDVAGDAWDLHDTRSHPAEVARRSLITWDGQGDLGDLITRKFGVFHLADGKTRCLWLCNHPVVIRVLYSPPASDAPPPPPPSLSHITFDGLRARQEQLAPSGTIIHPPESHVRRYVLIVAVRLREHDEDRDLIHRYTIRGTEIPGPPDYPYANPHWTLGQPGRQYMLFYSPVLKRPIGYGARQDGNRLPSDGELAVGKKGMSNSSE
ncbi:hypothetical protein F4821DRAFT_263061 [Hypoxylon rubiginosum]|uniref:Uncharacterized protein n=1 Tax=Hypoxylon rubiginosum TaxID=110542 RepID=A0ACC0CSB8_9PEZI|nr:hypothetical protein F4821DRAFT_263061 [Hypoxylon rubiginosum]